MFMKDHIKLNGDGRGNTPHITWCLVLSVQARGGIQYLAGPIHKHTGNTTVLTTRLDVQFRHVSSLYSLASAFLFFA